ncbi:ABC transporter permease [Streptomonospora nanhaiensis]|uniref:Transport permease protein n=1 Tax=Streptomonospora nanhaiensis TaxID=1323731 RepID=A0A853BT69_9ACTN|nr:ABC transporter permease [Streptomonospora nanhaiensis]MBV2367088.1 ABC transporter permease [Streptomonospora nanhaiensis]MBX9389553.1 ABC transporter permease [Streptomonospora nanhaiensis]NYI97727.1 ABC-2 type transport system permease protein [Streptomonospora nanhaiensis]
MPSRALAVWQNRQVVSLLVARDLKVKYQKSILGYAWSMLEPLAMAGVYFFVFGLIFNTNRGVPGGDDAPGGYLLFLISGLLPWLWFSQSLSQAPNALISHAKLITTMKVPREIFPIEVVAAKFVDYLFTWPVLLLFVFALGGRTSAEGLLVWLPLAIVVQIVFSLGMTLLLASVNVLVRDIERVVRILNRVLFYASAIIIPSSLVLDSDFPDWFVTLYQLNPLLGIFKMHHAVWYPADAPNALILSTSIGGALILLVAGYLTFRRLETSVLKEL